MTWKTTRRAVLALVLTSPLVPKLADAGPADDSAITASFWTKIGGKAFAEQLAVTLEGAPSIQDAALRQRAAAAAAGEQKAALFPQLSTALNASDDRRWIRGSDPSSPGNSTAATATVSWALDLWGKARDELRIARLEADAQIVDLEGARIVLALQLAEAVASRKRSEIQLNRARKILGIQLEIARKVSARHLAGLASEADLADAEAAVRSGEIAVTEAHRADSQTASSLVAIMAADPRMVRPEAIQLAQEQDTDLLAEEVTYANLSSRPDLRAIEIRLNAAGVRVNLARRALYPDLSVSQSISGSSNQFEAMLAPRNLATQLAGSLAMTVFDGGRRKAQRRIAELELERLAVTQRARLFVAADEVVRARAGLRAINALIPQRGAALEARRRSVNLARAQNRAGKLSTLELLRLEEVLQNEEAEVLALPADQFLASATLLAALGVVP